MESAFPEFSLPKSIPGILLGKIGKIDVVRPKLAAIPIEEGMHLAIVDSDQLQPWENQSTKQLLKLAFFSLPAAKIIAEGGYTDDMWANIHFNARPHFNIGVNVFGRNPRSSVGWGKPVNIRTIAAKSLSKRLIAKIRTAFMSNLPYWQDLYRQTSIFPDGISILPAHSLAYKTEMKKYAAINEHVIWSTQQYIVVMVGNPHLSGLHLVVHARSAYWGKSGNFSGWQFPVNPREVSKQIQGFLEICAISLSLEKILVASRNLPFHRPEIHFSGNWGIKKEDLAKKESALRKLIQWRRQEYKTEAFKERIWGGSGWCVSNHGHLYATRDPQQYVCLPERPITEEPDKWKGILPLPPDEADKIRELVSHKLESYLEKETQGYLAG